MLKFNSMNIVSKMLTCSVFNANISNFLWMLHKVKGKYIYKQKIN